MIFALPANDTRIPRLNISLKINIKIENLMNLCHQISSVTESKDDRRGDSTNSAQSSN